MDGITGLIVEAEFDGITGLIVEAEFDGITGLIVQAELATGEGDDFKEKTGFRNAACGSLDGIGKRAGSADRVSRQQRAGSADRASRQQRAGSADRASRQQHTGSVECSRFGNRTDAAVRQPAGAGG